MPIVREREPAARPGRQQRRRAWTSPAGLSAAPGCRSRPTRSTSPSTAAAPLVTCQLYAGKIEARVRFARRPRDRAPSSPERSRPLPAGSPAARRSSRSRSAATDARIRFRGLIRPEAGDVDITRESILVSVGRGIGEQDNLELVEALAAALGGAVSSSRPIADAGWLPRTRQVGKSGLRVKPKLYLALGISGAPEHLEGMRDAELIIAVNTDPRAPIFGVAHYGAVADLLDVVPALTARLGG